MFWNITLRKEGERKKDKDIKIHRKNNELASKVALNRGALYSTELPVGKR